MTPGAGSPNRESLQLYVPAGNDLIAILLPVPYTMLPATFNVNVPLWPATEVNVAVDVG